MRKGYNFEIREKENFETGIQRILNTLHNNSAQLIIARSRQHVSIHRLRVNLKKIRGILRLLRYDLGNEKYHQLNQSYGSIANTISILRDYTSQIELLESLKGKIDDKQLNTIFSKLIRQLIQERTLAYKQFLSINQPHKIQQSIIQINATLQELITSSSSELFILKGLAKVYSNTRNTHKTNDLWKNHERYHYWRKQVKYLMYHLTVLKKSKPDYLQVYIGELKRLGSLLGKLHDFHLLNEIIAEQKLFNGNKIQSDKLMNIIASRQVEIINKTKIISERLFSESSKSFTSRIHTLWKNANQ